MPHGGILMEGKWEFHYICEEIGTLKENYFNNTKLS
jgi:hypothetical protein